MCCYILQSYLSLSKMKGLYPTTITTTHIYSSANIRLGLIINIEGDMSKSLPSVVVVGERHYLQRLALVIKAYCS